MDERYINGAAPQAIQNTGSRKILFSITAAAAPKNISTTAAVTDTEKLFVLPVAFNAFLSFISRKYADCFSFPLNAADLAAIVPLGFSALKRPSVMLSGVSSNTRHIPITAVSIARILNTTVVSPSRFKFL